MTWREYFITWAALIALVGTFAVLAGLFFAWVIMPAFLSLWYGTF